MGPLLNFLPSRVIDNTYCPNASSTPERFSPVNSSALLAFSKIKKNKKNTNKKSKRSKRPPTTRQHHSYQISSHPIFKSALDWRNVRKNVSCRHHLKSWLYLWPRLFEFMDFSIEIFIGISLVDPPHKNSLFRALLSALAAGCVFEGVAFVSQLKNSPDVSSDLVAKRGDWPWWEVLERKKKRKSQMPWHCANE